MRRLGLPLGFPPGVLGGGAFGSGEAVFGSGEAIYGVSWTGAVGTAALTRTDDAVGLTAETGVDAAVVTNDFDALYPWSDFTEVTDASGNVFVRIPKFYVEKTANGAARTWRVSKKGGGAGYLPKCFVASDGSELDYVDVGKYPAGLDGSNRLTSKASEYPLVSKNIVEFRGYAEANGSGYHQFDIHVLDLLQTLFTVEFATLNSQDVMAGFTAGQYSASHTVTVDSGGNTNTVVVSNATGANYRVGQAISLGTTLGGNQIAYGRTITAIDVDTPGAGNTQITFDGAAVTTVVGNIVYNTGWRSGWSSAVAASSGCIADDTSGKYPMMYRGIENIYGNVWQFVDGININDNQSWVCNNPADYVSNLFAAPYEALSYLNGSAAGYISAKGLDPAHPYAEISTAVAGNSGAPWGDYYYQDSGQRVALLGGSWYYGGAAAGLSCWALDPSSSVAYVVIGGRLCRKAG